MKTIKRNLESLRVKPGLRLTTVRVCADPWVSLMMFYDRDASAFCLEATWDNGRKTIRLPEHEVVTSRNSRWITDSTHRLTDEAVARIAPGLEALVDKLRSLRTGATRS